MEILDLILIALILAVDTCMLVLMIKEYEMHYEARYGPRPGKRRKR